MNSSRCIGLGVLLIVAGFCAAQVPVPFTSKDGRFMVFANKRFEKLEPREPRRTIAQEGRVIYVDHEGRLRVFIAEGRILHQLEDDRVDRLEASRGAVAWMVYDSLKTLRGGHGKLVATGVERFTVSDSLLVYHAAREGTLNVVRQGLTTVLAEVEQSSEAPQWSTGTNTVTFFDRSAHKLFLFYRGTVRVLCDSTNVGLAVNGLDVAAFWDPLDMQFKVQDQEEVHVISELRPVSAKAGKGMVAFVDGMARLRCYTGGVVHTLTDSMPTDYWVQDDLLLYLQGGALHLFRPEGTVLVERYVPERWQVWGDRLVYLDINRELHGIEDGEALRYGNEAAIASFDLFGDAVFYRSPTGLMTVIRNGKKFLY